ncbi:MAG TPA: cupredoxin family protein [Burkholderiales bacterium]
MKARMLMLAALALTPIAGYAQDDAHQGMMHGKAGGGHSENGGHEQGVGEPGDPKKVSRTIQVLMSDDMKFTPAKVNVKRGETIKFVVRNAGRIKHEMVIGSMAELKEHAELMRKMPGMEHADSNQVTLDPGKTGELVWQFTKAGTVDFACLQPGHFEAGMMGTVSVK